MKNFKVKQSPYYLTTALLLGITLGHINTVAYAADITTPITLNKGENKTINENFTITDLGSSKYALGINKGSVDKATSITFNGNVNLNLDKSVGIVSLIDISNSISSSGSVNVDIKGSEFNIIAKTDNAGDNFNRFVGINLSNRAVANVFSKTNINIYATDSAYSYATFGEGLANFKNDLTINMNGGTLVVGLGSKAVLSGANNNINITSQNSKVMFGMYNLNNNAVSTSELSADTTTNINIMDTGSIATRATAIGSNALLIDKNAVVNINVSSQAKGLTDTNKFLGMEDGANGIIIQSSSLKGPPKKLEIAQGAKVNINVEGSAVNIQPGLAPDTNYLNNTGLGGATGISSAGDSIINGDVNINVLSTKGTGIKVITYNPDAKMLYTGNMQFNGETIVNAAGGYALLSATSSTAYRDRFSNDLNYWQVLSTISINENGGSLVQLTGDIDHMGLFNSRFDINLDRADSFLRGAALLSNVRQYHNEYGTVVADGNQTNITLANGATWHMTGKSEINTSGNSIVNKLQFANKGLLDMTAGDSTSGYTYERLNINTLAGDDGRILMNTNLQQSFDNKDVKTDGDRVYIEKYSNQYEIDHPNDNWAPVPKLESPLSAGIHTIDIKDASLLNKIEAEKGYLLLVEDHTQGNAQFVGGQLQKGGIFKYKPIITNEDPLDYINIPKDSNNWYLTGFEKMGIKDEAIVNAGLAESRYIAYLNEQDTLIKRLGELRQNDKEQGIWARVRGANNSVDGFGVHRNSYVSTHLGYDRKLKEREGSKAKRYMGVAFNHTNNNFDYTAGATGKGQSNVLTLYGTRLGDKGHYLDLVGKIGRMSNNHKYQGQQVEAKNWFYSLSAEYGRSIVREKGWYYEPQIQFTFGHINGASYNSKESSVKADSINSAILRAGILAGRKFNEDKPEKNGSYYAKLFWNHEFGGNVKASMTDVYGDRFAFSHSYSGSWITVGLGTSLNLNKKTNIYLDVEKSFGGKVNGGWAWQGGVRWRF